MSKANSAKKAEKKTAKKEIKKAAKKAAKIEREAEKKAAKKSGLKVTSMTVARSRAKPGDVNPFVVASHPPSVMGAASSMANDSAIGASLQWASSTISGVFSEGLAFLGYPYLSELAQRPEYRRIAETLATEMTRKWIELEAVGGKNKSAKLQKIKAAMKKLKVRQAFRKAAEQDALFGRSHAFLDLGNTNDAQELAISLGAGDDEMSKAKVSKGKFKAIKPVEAVWCYPSGYDSTDPLHPNWYKPASWFVQGREIHSTRLLTFVGREVPDLLKPAYSFGGLSMSQMAKPYVDNWLRTRQSVADLISSFSVNGIYTSLVDSLGVSEEEENNLFNRIDVFNNIRDNRGTMVLDKEREEFFNVSTPLSTLDALQAQTQEHMAAVSGIPIIKLLGISPAGLNASSEGEIRAFYDWIESYQEHLFRENLERVLDFIQLSLFGDIDPDITFKFVHLWSLDEKEAAEVRKVDAETGKILIESKTISPEEERQRIAADPDAPYASLDTDQVPDSAVSDVDKATIAVNVTNAIATAVTDNIIGRPTALRELKKLSTETGVFTTITDQDIADAEDDPPLPGDGDYGEPPGPGGQVPGQRPNAPSPSPSGV